MDSIDHIPDRGYSCMVEVKRLFSICYVEYFCLLLEFNTQGGLLSNRTLKFGFKLLCKEILARIKRGIRVYFIQIES